ncbi:MAG: OprD family outer membrane porin, partial [Desulfovibrionaceae bacterium]
MPSSRLTLFASAACLLLLAVSSANAESLQENKDNPIQGMHDPPLQPEPEPTIWTALQNGTLKGYSRVYYKRRHVQKDDTQESLAIGGGLHYQTGWWNNLAAGLAGYTSQPLWYFPESKGGTGVLTRKNQGYSSLGQAYLKARGFNSTFTGYRQALDTPFLVNPNDSCMTPITFEAYTIQSQPLENLEILASHVTKMKDRTSTTFVEMSKAAGYAAKQPVSLLGVTWRFLDNYKITAWEYYSWAMMNSVYAEVTGDWAVTDDFDMWAGIQGLYQQDTGQAIAGHFTTGALGAKVGGAYKGFDLELAVTLTDQNRDIVNPYNGAYAGYNSIMEEDFNRAGENSGRVSVHYDLGRLTLTGVHAFFTFCQSVTPDSGPHASPDQ